MGLFEEDIKADKISPEGLLGIQETEEELRDLTKPETILDRQAKIHRKKKNDPYGENPPFYIPD